MALATTGKGLKFLNILKYKTESSLCLHLCKRWLLYNNATEISIFQARKKLFDMVGTKDMWRDLSELSKTLAPIPESQAELPLRSMRDSYQEVIIPLRSEKKLRGRYITLDKGLRFGRILEDLDTFSVFLCYTHNLYPTMGQNQKSPVIAVTALVDRIELQTTDVSPFHDIKMIGHVTWTGVSSLEVTMYLHQEQEGHWQELLTAKFVMVIRNPITKKGAPVNPLKPETPEEQAVFQKGAESRHIRQEEAKISLLRIPPNLEETQLVHELFLKTIDQRSGTFHVRIKPENSVWMEDTLLKNVIICHPEERNLYNKIFGGFLMRQAYEIAWANASLFCRNRPVIKAVDDIVFRKPVDIGSLLFLTSQIIYTEGSKFKVKVHAEVVDPLKGIHETTNDFHFKFDSANPHLPQVVPKTYAEAMLYLDGKRHIAH